MQLAAACVSVLWALVAVLLLAPLTAAQITHVEEMLVGYTSFEEPTIGAKFGPCKSAQMVTNGSARR